MLCIYWQVVTAPTKTTVGTQYLVAATGATGDFAGHENQIAYRTASGWKFYSNFVGQLELFNLEDKKIYRYETDGTTTSWGSHTFGSATDEVSQEVKDEISSRIEVPVKAMVQSGTALPATCAAGDLFVNTATNKIYTATGDDTWDTGVDPVEGDRYASLTDGKIYTADETPAFVASTVADGAVFVSKKDDNVWSYDGDGTKFINLTSVKDRPEYKKHVITVTHTLTAEELAVKQFNLPKLAEVADGVLCSVGGVVQVPGVDYTVTNAAGVSTFKWDTLGLSDIMLMAGDVFVLTYNTEVD